MKESGEMYLETVYVLSEKGEKSVHAVDVAKALSLSRPSVKRGVDKLKERGLVEQDFYGGIKMTAEGIAYAERIHFKHRTITSFLTLTLNLPLKTAEADACRIEHIISDETAAEMARYVEEHEGLKQ